MKNYFVYILLCSDNTFYTGYTNDLENRLLKHNSKSSKTKYTRSRQPVKLVYKETFNNKSHALKREYQIKQLNKNEKLFLIEKKHE